MSETVLRSATTAIAVEVKETLHFVAMQPPFKTVSIAEFERMNAEEREKYIDTLIEHLQELRRVPSSPVVSHPQKPGFEGKQNH